MSPRPHLALQVLLTVLAVVGGLVGLDRGVTTRLPPGTSTGHVQLLRLLDSLPTPHEVVRDPYATACGVPSRFCVSSPEHGRSTVSSSVVDLLRKHGARVLDHSCGTTPRTCVDLLVVDGVGVQVWSSDRAGASPGVEVPAYAAVVIPSQPLVQVVGAPLPPLALLRLAPPRPAVVPCLERRGAGCMSYAGQWSGPGSAVVAVDRWRDLLLSLGYRLDGQACEPAGTGQRCSLSATKFRTFGGLDPVHVSLVVVDGPGGLARSDLRVATAGAV